MTSTRNLRQFYLGMDPYILVQIKGVRDDDSLDLDISYGGGVTEADLPGFFSAMTESMPYAEDSDDTPDS